MPSSYILRADRMRRAARATVVLLPDEATALRKHEVNQLALQHFLQTHLKVNGFLLKLVISIQIEYAC